MHRHIERESQCRSSESSSLRLALRLTDGGSDRHLSCTSLWVVHGNSHLTTCTEKPNIKRILLFLTAFFFLANVTYSQDPILPFPNADGDL